MSATVSPASEDDEHANDRESDDRSKTDRLRAYLADKAAEQGELYVKGKFIADDVGLSPKQIGQLMIELQETASEIEIEKWSYTGATTWRVARTSA